MERRYKVKLNSNDKIEDLLQEIYDQSCRLVTEIQNEMNGLINSTNLGEVGMDEKSKYSKAIHDYIGDKTKAVAMKFEIAKFMGEILKHNGDADAVLNDPSFKKNTKLDLASIRAEISKSTNGPDSYKLKNS